MFNIPHAFVGWEVLVADDESDNLEIARRMLQMAGAKVTTAANGKLALELIQANPTAYKFILSDLSMPEMDGWELLYELKQEPRTQNIPVIALTAHAMVGDRERGIGAGFHNYITKPLDPTKFIRQLITLLKDVPEYRSLLTTV